MNKGIRVLAAALTAVLAAANSFPALAAGSSLPTDTAVAGIALNISEYNEKAENSEDGLKKVMSAATAEKADEEKETKTTSEEKKDTTDAEKATD